MRTKWKILFGVAIFNDLLDLTGIGAVPILGDFLDIISTSILWMMLGTKPTAPTLLEFIPGVGLLPIYTATVAVAHYRDRDTNLNSMDDKNKKKHKRRKFSRQR